VHSSIYSSSNSIDDDDEIVEPGKMRVSEIKGELELQGIGFDDCFDKESLVKRLKDARATGKADPSILEAFNKKKLEENVTGKRWKLGMKIYKSQSQMMGLYQEGLIRNN
jgi:hypothetical protein